MEWYIIVELLFDYGRKSLFTKTGIGLCSYRKAYPSETRSVGSCRTQKISIRSNSEVVRFLAIGFRPKLQENGAGFYQILLDSDDSRISVRPQD